MPVELVEFDVPVKPISSNTEANTSTASAGNFIVKYFVQITNLFHNFFPIILCKGMYLFSAKHADQISSDDDNELDEIPSPGDCLLSVGSIVWY